MGSNRGQDNFLISQEVYRLLGWREKRDQAILMEFGGAELGGLQGDPSHQLGGSKWKTAALGKKMSKETQQRGEGGVNEKRQG